MAPFQITEIGFLHFYYTMYHLGFVVITKPILNIFLFPQPCRVFPKEDQYQAYQNVHN